MDVTAEQAQAAKWLVNDAGAFAALIALAQQLTPETINRIRAAHDNEAVKMCCNAHCEGLNCCIDILTEDPAKYAPEKVAEALRVLDRWREQQPQLDQPRITGASLTAASRPSRRARPSASRAAPPRPGHARSRARSPG